MKLEKEKASLEQNLATVDEKEAELLEFSEETFNSPAMRVDGSMKAAQKETSHPIIARFELYT